MFVFIVNIQLISRISLVTILDTAEGGSLATITMEFIDVSGQIDRRTELC